MNINPATLFVGQNRVNYDTTDSTNSRAAALVADKPPEGTVILAKQQSAGRGQQGSSWESDYGLNLLCSFIFYPTFLSPRRIFNLNMMCSLALYDVANGLASGIAVKWPNDLYCKDQKLAGMLIENSIRNNELNHSIIGIGMNINQVSFSPHAANPTSLKRISGIDHDVEHVFSLLCRSLEARYLQLKSGRHDQLKSDYINVLYRFQADSIFHAQGKTFAGKIVDVQDDGRLMIEKEDGTKEVFGFKEVSFA